MYDVIVDNKFTNETSVFSFDNYDAAKDRMYEEFQMMLYRFAVEKVEYNKDLALGFLVEDEKIIPALSVKIKES